MKTSISLPPAWLGFVALLSVLTSCSPTIYNANSLNVPLLSRKGNTKLSLGTAFRGGDDFTLYNTNLQAAYAVSDHLGVMANGMYHDFKRTYTPFFSGTSRTDRHKEGFVEAGMGYYSSIGDSSRWRWDCYGGFGVGRTRETDPDNTNTLILTSPYQRIFVQPSIGFVSKYFEVAFSARASYLFVGEINWAGDDTDGKIVKGALFEPCVTLRAGGRSVKPFFQYSWLLFNDQLDPVIGLEGLVGKFLTVQIGVSANLKE